MRKASIIPWMILLWIIILVLILFSKFGPVSIKQGFNDLLKNIIPGKQAEEGTREQQYTTTVPAGAYPEIILSEDPIDSKRQLVDAAYYCWQRMKTTPQTTHNCGIVHARSIGSDTQNAIIQSLRYRDPSAADSLNSNWKIPIAITPYIGDFYICAQKGSFLSSDKISFTYDLGTCGLSGGSTQERSLMLSEDAQIATQQLLGSLARCWSIAKALGRDGACDTISASRLGGTVTKDTILLNANTYFDQSQKNILDDWWEPDNDAHFPLAITAQTNPFVSCSSDFADWFTRADLCFTFDRNNDCCT